jgi:hypothetical protein
MAMAVSGRVTVAGHALWQERSMRLVSIIRPCSWARCSQSRSLRIQVISVSRSMLLIASRSNQAALRGWYGESSKSGPQRSAS